jgi:hypothetical protein
MAVNSLGAALVGFSSPGTALSLLHPSGGPGCSLHASGEATVLLWPNAGSVDFQFTIPNNVAFAGFVLFHQVLQAEFAQTQLTGLSSSNGLRLTVGAF